MATGLASGAQKRAGAGFPFREDDGVQCPGCSAVQPAQELEFAQLLPPDPARWLSVTVWWVTFLATIGTTRRVRTAGYHIQFDPEAKLWHKVSVSTQKSDKPSRWWYTMGRSTVRFYRQHSTSSALITYSAWFAVREIVKLKPRRVLPFLTGVKHELACKS
jgi:hypothetical protein